VGKVRTAIVCYEDREPSIIGLKLLALSITRHSPRLPIYIYTSEALISQNLVGWLGRHAPKASLLPAPQGAPAGWSMKPHVLMDALDRHCDVAVWLDADLMLNGPIEPRFEGLPSTTISVASETGRANPMRATIWGFDVVRPLSFVVNSCVIRCTRSHLPLLKEWARLTNAPLFLEAQAKSLGERHPALYSDQDLLEGILISDALGDRPTIGVDFIRHDVEIVHGTRMAFRYCITASRQLPRFVHAHVLKPSHLPLVQWPRRRWLRYVAVELSIYAWLSRQYAGPAEDELIGEWMWPRTLFGKSCDKLTLSHPYLRLLPVQIVERIKGRISSTLSKSRGWQ
jgi:hypothetical protein